MINNSRKESIAVVGGGMTGITAAIELAKSGRFDVTLFEKQERLGGLSGWFQWGDVCWDRFYHVILSTDTLMLNFLKELGLGGELFWRETKSGFYGDGRLVSMSSAIDFIKFPFMTVWQKFRLGLGILYSARIKDPARLDRIYIREWLTKVFGRRVYEKIWDPLLRSKLGEASERTSAAFIWATINRLYGARSSENKLEKMGHVHGGYKRILEAAEKQLKELGVRIVHGATVTKIEPGSSGEPTFPASNLQQSAYSPQLSDPKFSALLKADNQQICIYTNGTKLKFSNVLLTVDCPTVLKIIENREPASYWAQLEQVEYLGVICVLLILKVKLSPYYVVNLLDRQLPFTGIIEATNIVSPGEVGGKHIVYLPKYLLSTDPLNGRDDQEIKKLFLSGLRMVYPNLTEDEILHCEVYRERYVQPLQGLNYLTRKTPIATPLQNVYMVNTSMFYNSTLNNNAVLTLTRKAATVILNSKIKATT